MIAPAKARPKESPKFPAAEFTPAASLIRSSEIGASVKLLSWETSMPSPDPAMINGMREVPAGIRAGHDQDQQHHPDGEQGEPGPDDDAWPPLAGLLAGQQRDGEHAQRKRRQRQTGLHGVVLEHHLEEDRQRDHHAAERDLLQHLLGNPDPEMRGPEQIRIQQGQFVLALAPDQPPGECRERERRRSRSARPPTRRPPARRGCPARRRPCPARSRPRRRRRCPAARCTAHPSPCLMPESTIAMMTTSSRKPTRHDR